MPRNRKKQRPSELVEVRRDDDGVLHCGRCGQRFPHIFNERAVTHVTAWDEEGYVTRQVAPDVVTRVSDDQATPWLTVMSITAWGWRFDGTAWRPTAESRAEWDWACEVVRCPERHSEQDVQRARAGLTRGQFHRNDKARTQKVEFSVEATKDMAQRFTLPTKIECIQCGVLNIVKSG